MAAGWIANHCEGPSILAAFGTRGMIPLGVAPGWWGELQLGQSSVENYAGSNTALTTAALPQHLLERFCIGRRNRSDCALSGLLVRAGAPQSQRAAEQRGCDRTPARVETATADRNNDVFAVQALRNATMAATFPASTSIRLVVGMMTLS